MLTIKSTINIAGQTVPQIIPVVQGDTGRAVLFTLADFTIPTGATATYYIQKPSGEAVYNAATIDGNTVLVELTAQSIIEVGDNYGQVRIEKDDEVVTSFDFILLVKSFRGIDATQSTTEMNIFDKAVEQAEEAIDEAKDAALEEIAEASENIAEEFDASNSYLAGEYTIYQGKLYKFTSAHTGAWTGSDAEEVTVGDELTSLNEEIGDLKDGLSDMDDRVTALEEGGTGGGLTEDIKQALLQIAEKVVYIDEHGQDYYDALEEALYPPADLVSISAVYTQSGTVYDTDTLDSLKSDLVVTALYDDQTTETVTTYTLSGTLAVGTSTITVSYGGKTATFTVEVTEHVPVYHTGYTEVGNPTISNNILTVADGKFIKSNVEFSPGDSSWRITCKYRNTSGAYASYTDILGSVDSSNASYRSILLESTINTGTALSMYLSSNGTSWDIGSGNNTQATDIPAGQNVWVWIDFSFDGSSYILKYSSDGETFTTGKIYAHTGKVVSGYPVGFGMKRNGYLQGEIDLSECKIWIDGDLYWSAV